MSVLSTSIDVLESKLDWLQTRFDLDDAGLRKIVLTFPQLFNYSVEDNMAPKLAYLEREISLSRPVLREHVLRNPAILGYSLDKRYRPRVEACRAAGVDAKCVLSYASRTDEYFCEKTGIAPEGLVAARESVLSV